MKKKLLFQILCGILVFFSVYGAIKPIVLSHYFMLPHEIDEEVIIPAKNERILNGTGLKTKEGIYSNGESGFLVYGPYFNPPDGIFTIGFQVENLEKSNSGDTLGFVDVYANGEVFASKQILDDLKESEMILEGISFKESFNVEFRMYVEPQTKLVFKGFHVIKTDDVR